MEAQPQRKILFQGIIRSVQVRSNVWRYRVDNRTHSTTGYNLFMHGMIFNEDDKSIIEYDIDFSVAISEIQQQKMHFRIGDEIKGSAWTKKYVKWEYADYYRAGSLQKIASFKIGKSITAPPYTDEVPELSVYNWRGCRMLDARRYKGKCFTCKCACMANVAIEYDWGKSQRFHFESFCYGPKSCKLYAAGKPRAVPYKGCGSSYDEGFLDEVLTENRGDESAEAN